MNPIIIPSAPLAAWPLPVAFRMVAAHRKHSHGL